MSKHRVIYFLLPVASSVNPSFHSDSSESEHLSMDWLFFLLGAVAVLGINCFFWSSGREDLVSPFNLLLVLVCSLGLAICFLMHDSGSETHSKKNRIESSCEFPLEQKCLHALFFVSRDYPAGNQFQIAKQENGL